MPKELKARGGLKSGATVVFVSLTGAETEAMIEKVYGPLTVDLMVGETLEEGVIYSQPPRPRRRSWHLPSEDTSGQE